MLGVEMIGPQERDLGSDGVLRIAFARTPRPYLELIEGPPGSIWDSTDGPRMHHLAYWSEDMDADSTRLEAAGLKREIDLGLRALPRPGRRHRNPHRADLHRAPRGLLRTVGAGGGLSQSAVA